MSKWFKLDDFPMTKKDAQMYGCMDVQSMETTTTDYKLKAYSLQFRQQQINKKKAGEKISPAFYIYGF